MQTWKMFFFIYFNFCLNSFDRTPKYMLLINFILTKLYNTNSKITDFTLKKVNCHCRFHQIVFLQDPVNYGCQVDTIVATTTVVDC